MKKFIGLLWLTLSVTTVANAETKQPKLAQRIIALAPHIVEMMYAIGAGDLIVGTTDHADYPVAAQSIPRIANYARVQIEQVVALKPDLIIAWKSGNPSDDIQRLRDLGFKVVYSQPDLLSDVAKELRYFGQLAGVTEQAELAASHYEQLLDKIGARYRDKAQLQVFYEAWSNPLTTINHKAWPHQVLTLCNAVNVFSEASSNYPQVGLEQVVAANPRIIIQPGPKRKTGVNAIDWSQWPIITAVKQQQIVSPDSDMMHRMTPRIVEEADFLCAAIDQFRR